MSPMKTFAGAETLPCADMVSISANGSTVIWVCHFNADADNYYRTSGKYFVAQRRMVNLVGRTGAA